MGLSISASRAALTQIAQPISATPKAQPPLPKKPEVSASTSNDLSTLLQELNTTGPRGRAVNTLA